MVWFGRFGDSRIRVHFIFGLAYLVAVKLHDQHLLRGKFVTTYSMINEMSHEIKSTSWKGVPGWYLMGEKKDRRMPITYEIH